MFLTSKQITTKQEGEEGRSGWYKQKEGNARMVREGRACLGTGHRVPGQEHRGPE